MPVILVIMVLITIMMAGVVWRYVRDTTSNEDDPGTGTRITYAFDPVNEFPCDENLCGTENDLCLTVRNKGADPVSIRDLSRMSITLISGNSAKQRTILPYELYVYFPDESVEAEGNEYPLCCNITDTEVIRTSRCGNHTGVWSNKRITLAFNSTSFDEYSAERYNVIFAG
jgi:hypothetical protein